MKLRTLALVLLCSTGFAQMGGGPGGGHGPGGGTPPVPGITPQPIAFPMMGPFGMSPLIAPDGTIITDRAVPPVGENPPGRELIAITPAGTLAWSTAIQGFPGELVIAGDAVVGTFQEPPTEPRPLAFPEMKTTVRAFALSSGAARWSRELMGSTMNLKAGGDRVIVTLFVFDAAEDPMPMRPFVEVRQSLLAISVADGTVLWTFNTN